MSDDDLMKEGVSWQGEWFNGMNNPVQGGDVSVHDQLGILPASNILNELAGSVGDNSR
jgi:hypothetical protein